MKIVLFCGGLGMRMREYSDVIPKPMIEIGYRPLIWHVMKYYAHYGHTDFVLCLGHRGDVIKQYFLNYDECLSNDFVLSNGGRDLQLRSRDIDDWRVTLVDTGLNANIGQRLKAVEPYLDGAGNSVYECNSGAVPSEHGNAWAVTPTLLASEQQAQRTIEPRSARYWKITNPGSLNSLGEPVAYKLQPGDNCFPYFTPDSQQGRRGGFASNHLWVTAYDPATQRARVVVVSDTDEALQPEARLAVGPELAQILDWTFTDWFARSTPIYWKWSEKRQQR